MLWRTSSWLGDCRTSGRPFRGDSVVKLNRAAETPRDRRLVADEEMRLLKAIQRYPLLMALFFAARETGCRIGELLTLQWRNVDLAGNEVTLISTRTKPSGRGRFRSRRDSNFTISGASLAADYSRRLAAIP